MFRVLIEATDLRSAQRLLDLASQIETEKLKEQEAEMKMAEENFLRQRAEKEKAEKEYFDQARTVTTTPKISNTPITDEVIARSAAELMKAPDVLAIPQAPTIPQLPKLEQAEPNVGDTDNRGIPWLEGVHSSSKAKNKDGSWRVRRGVTDEEVGKAEAPYIQQFRDTQPPLAPPPVPVVPSQDIRHVTPSPVAQVVQVPIPQVTLEVVQAPPGHIPTLVTPTYVPPTPPAIAPVIPMPTNPAAIGGHTIETFKNNLVSIIARLINEAKITPEYVAQLCTYFKVGQLWEIFGDDTKVQQLFDNFVECGFVVKVG